MVKEAFHLPKRDLQAIIAFRSLFFPLFRFPEGDRVVHAFQYNDIRSISPVHHRRTHFFAVRALLASQQGSQPSAAPRSARSARVYGESATSCVGYCAGDGGGGEPPAIGSG